MTIPSTVYQSQIEITPKETNSTVEEEQKIMDILNTVDLQHKNSNIGNIEARFNKLQASIAMDSLKNHWKSKDGSIIQYESMPTQKKISKQINNVNTTQKTKQKQFKQDNENRIDNNKRIDSLCNMEIDYDWNGQYYYKPSTRQSAQTLVVKSNSKTCVDSTPSSIDSNFSLLYFISMIVYLVYYQVTNIDYSDPSTITHGILNDMSKIDNQVSQIEEVLIQRENCLNTMVYSCNYNIEHRNDEYPNMFSSSYSSKTNNCFSDHDYGASSSSQAPITESVSDSTSNTVVNYSSAAATANNPVVTSKTMATDTTPIDTQTTLSANIATAQQSKVSMESIITKLNKMGINTMNPKMYFQNINSSDLQAFPNYILLGFDTISEEIQDPKYCLTVMDKEYNSNGKHETNCETLLRFAIPRNSLESKLPSLYHRSRYKLK